MAYKISEGEKELSFDVPFVENRARKKSLINPPLKTSPLRWNSFEFIPPSPR